MIHISHEELFKKIAAEHNCSEEQEATSEESIGSGRGRGRVGEVASGGAAELRRGSRSSIDMSAMMLDLRHAASIRQQAVPSTTPTTPTTRRLSKARKDSLSARDNNNNDNDDEDEDDDDDDDDDNDDTTQKTPTTPTTTTQQASAGSNLEDQEVQAVLITGCGSKVGSNIAVAFAAQGLKVALVDFDIAQTELVARECQEKSPKSRVPLQIVADMSQLAEAHKVIDRTIAAFGRLDVLVNTVNNAGLMEAKFNASGDDDPHVFEQYHKIIANNMHSVTYLCISAAPYLRKTKGTIVNVSSITNNETGSYKFAYCMSKAGISTLTKCLATDLAPDIKVICVTPKSDAGT